MKIKITADSTCDLSEELLAQWDIALMPMHILMGEDSYLDGVTIHPAMRAAKCPNPPLQIWWNIPIFLSRLPKSAMR